MTSTTFSQTSTNNVIEGIGNTPLIELKSFSTYKLKIFARLEWLIPLDL